MILYFYDIKMKVNEYNTLKRRFYYHLARSKLSLKPRKTKSVLLIDDELEAEADEFFKSWKPAIVCFKAKTERLDRL